MQMPVIPSFDKITFGPGVIGRTGPIVAVGVICLTILAYATPVNEVKVAAGIADFLLLVLWLLASFRHADKHASTSVMEGAEAVRYHRQEMVAKGFVVDSLPDEVKQITPPPAQLLNSRSDNA